MKTRVIQSEPNRPIPSNNSASAVASSPNRPVTTQKTRGIAALIRRHPLPTFFVVAFAMTWATVPLGTFMAAGPLVAALIVISVVDGRSGLRDLGSGMLRWRVGVQWYAAAILIPLGVALATGGLNVALGASGSAFARLELSALLLAFAMRLVVPVFAPVGEEPGWRGFALPRLQAERSPLASTLTLGIIVAVWHVPLVFLTGEHLAPVFLLATVAVTFFYTWIFNHTRGSVLMTIIAHAAEGLLVAAFIGNNGFGGASGTRFTVLYTAGWCAVALVLVVFDRKMWRKPARL
jgi:membrane protease YdiL (CAAX protease family)